MISSHQEALCSLVAFKLLATPNMKPYVLLSRLNKLLATLLEIQESTDTEQKNGVIESLSSVEPVPFIYPDKT